MEKKEKGQVIDFNFNTMNNKQLLSWWLFLKLDDLQQGDINPSTLEKIINSFHATPSSEIITIFKDNYTTDCNG